MNALITSKKIHFPIEPALDLGLGSRATSTDQTAQDVTTHIGGGLCAFKLVCGALVYDFQEKDRRFNLTVDLISLLTLSGKVLSASP